MDTKSDWYRHRGGMGDVAHKQSAVRLRLATMTPDLLHRVGLTLYGPHWRAPLSAALRVDERTMRRWANGDRDMPPGIMESILALIHRRDGEMLALYQDVRDAADAFARVRAE